RHELPEVLARGDELADLLLADGEVQQRPDRGVDDEARLEFRASGRVVALVERGAALLEERVGRLLVARLPERARRREPDHRESRHASAPHGSLVPGAPADPRGPGFGGADVRTSTTSSATDETARATIQGVRGAFRLGISPARDPSATRTAALAL